MVDFKKLKKRNKKVEILNPIEIFRRLPKSSGITDLYASQAEVLESWFSKKDQKDTVIKLHTGGGKTLVGLLIAQSCMVDLKEPVLYLVPTRQLVSQTLEKALSYGIRAVQYKIGEPFNDEFLNGSAILIATYKALFNGRSKFKLRGETNPQKVGAIILDDAHTAFSEIRDSFTISISSVNKNLYTELCATFRYAFNLIDRVGIFDDVVSGYANNILEIPYWAWKTKLDIVREIIKSEPEIFKSIEWPLFRDNLKLCHAFISRDSFSITPIFPMLDLFPSFDEASRRIYMSATIADDSELIKTFDINKDAVSSILTSESLAGVSERMILIPESMNFNYDIKDDTHKLLKWVSKHDRGAIILVSSQYKAKEWTFCADFPNDKEQIEQYIKSLQKLEIFGPVVFANRYDGIDLPNDSCRLLVLSGLPKGTSDYELYKAAALYGGKSIIRLIAQRLEQGMGRGARGSTDYCVIILIGNELYSWISQKANFQFLTDATQAQLKIGMDVSREVESLNDLAKTIGKCFSRDTEWTTYYAETLDELIDIKGKINEQDLSIPLTERAAFNHWASGNHEFAIGTIKKLLQSHNFKDDLQTKGWLEQFMARITYDWGNDELAANYQLKAYRNNKNLLRPQQKPHYEPAIIKNSQAELIAKQICAYQFRGGLINKLNMIVSLLTKESTSNQFEQALMDFANFIGLHAERYDMNGEGPDVLWILPNKIGFVIEAKSRKKDKNALTKEEHGQLLVASEWFKKHYPDYECVRVSVHPENIATKASVAYASHALTYKNIAKLISDAKNLFKELCMLSATGEELIIQCAMKLNSSPLSADNIKNNYLLPFEEQN